MPSPLFQALVFGQFDFLPDETTFLLARTGLLPVFTGSGFHLAAARALTWPLRRWMPATRARDVTIFLVELALMALLATLTGWTSPLVRVFLLVTLSSGARLLEILPSRLHLFLVAVTASALLGKGSTMSFFFSVAGLAGLQFLPRWYGPWLCTLPLCLYYFSVLPLLAPLWFLTFGFALGVLVLPLGVLALLLPPLLPLVERLLSGLLPLLDAADRLTGGAFWIPLAPWLCALGICVLALRWKPFALLLIAVRLYPLPAAAALDVGQGDSIFLRTGLVEDVGPPGFHGRPAPAAHALEALGVGALHDVLLSHFDLDHRGGLDSVLARHGVDGALWFREVDLEAKRHEKVLGAAERAGVPIRFVTDSAAPRGLHCWLAPFRDGNDSCPLCRAELPGGHSLLLTGDMSFRAEDWFLANLTPFPTADILKVAHHGSRTSSSAEFLRATGAREALISVGARNRYHHPNAETLARLAQTGLRVRRTDLSGRLDFP